MLMHMYIPLHHQEDLWNKFMLMQESHYSNALPHQGWDMHSGNVPELNRPAGMQQPDQQRHHLCVRDLGETVLRIMQGWERNNFSAKWCRDMRLDTRGMSFAREVRRQLTDLVKRADFLPDRELAPDRKSGKRKRDSEGEPVPIPGLYGACCLSRPHTLHPSEN